MINKKRMAGVFESLARIDSVSKEETQIADRLGEIFQSLGAVIVRDGAGKRIGGNADNLIVKFPGTVAVAPMLLCAHMDTVEPGRGVAPVLKEGVFTSDGSTILGADDKSALAILIEVLQVLKEQQLAHGPIEVVTTVCEEIGLLGAKHLDLSLISAKFGYALDGSDTDGIVTRAPAANKLEFVIHGKDAHAGAAPEKGINAIMLAAKAMAGLEIGRIDAETTCNIGFIEGGNAINIVPSLVTIKGEVRSHDPYKLEKVTREIVSSFESIVNQYEPRDNDLPRLEVSVLSEFPRTHIPDEHPVVLLAKKAAQNLGRSLKAKVSGGGSDANVFFEKGIPTAVLGTGMQDMHTVRESVSVDDMVKTAELVLEMIRIHGKT